MTHGTKYDYSKTVYKGIQQRVTVICRDRGQFDQIARNHMNGSECPQCKLIERRKWQTLTTEKFIQKAKLIYGDIYDYSKVIYKRNDVNVTIICDKHGEFEQRASTHLEAHRCPTCGRESMKYSSEKFVEKAKLIHGEKYDYSESKYLGSNEKVVIICRIHGKFRQTPSCHYLNDCPRCSSGKSEERCREIFCSIMNVPFPNSRPKWLQKLTLDGYNEDLKLAFEYQGVQHEKIMWYDYDDEKYLIERKERDSRKRELCKENGVVLIEIPFQYTHRDKSRMKTFIETKLIESGMIFIGFNENNQYIK